eukprot:TRINITY_DN23212_c0_g1_i2.p1 TRINITY_DN23212_c0_g1~~TRINITY_DN23212_c0_g1_i2.p1  ORF type:complete len:261 (-),score=65.61 TRINITY_DN23212_c0_g1_i2:720-1502(-)
MATAAILAFAAHEFGGINEVYAAAGTDLENLSQFNATYALLCASAVRLPCQEIDEWTLDNRMQLDKPLTDNFVDLSESESLNGETNVNDTISYIEQLQAAYFKLDAGADVEDPGRKFDIEDEYAIDFTMPAPPPPPLSASLPAMTMSSTPSPPPLAKRSRKSSPLKPVSKAGLPQYIRDKIPVTPPRPTRARSSARTPMTPPRPPPKEMPGKELQPNKDYSKCPPWRKQTLGLSTLVLQPPKVKPPHSRVAAAYKTKSAS